MSTEKRKRHRRPPASEITPQTPIWCPACQAEHPASDFNKESRKFSGLHGICREAQRRARQTVEGRRKTSERNKRRWADPQYRAKSREWQRQRYERNGTAELKKARARLQAIVDEWKSRGCVDCGYSDIRAIDPDHVDSTTKDGTLSRMVQLCASETRIRRELEKCVPRCARCHRKITELQRRSKLRDRDKLPPSWQQKLDHQDRIDALKLGQGCADCGWRGWARGLDFDHVRGEKVGTISTLIGRGASWMVIVTELLKCECVCANCHRIRTLERGQYDWRRRSRDDRGESEVV